MTLIGDTIELLQTLIRNQCVNDGTPESGNEVRNAFVLRDYLEGPGVEIETFEPLPGRGSMVARMAGTDPDAPSICLMGHTDVVPVSPEGWRHDPFGGELIDGEIWGRGAVDMLNLTSSMAVAFRHIARSGQRPAGDLIYFGVADEEAGGVHGAEWILDRHWDHVGCDYVLTEFGGIPVSNGDPPAFTLSVAEKGLAWRRLIVSGTPGHGSQPYGTDNALVKAAEIVRRLAEYEPAPQLDALWEARIQAMDLDEDTKAALLDPGSIDETLAAMPPGPARPLHACSHPTFSPNVMHGGKKTNVIPDRVEIDVDIRTLPGETGEDIDRHVRAALGELADQIEVEILQDDPSSSSPIDTPMWDTISRLVASRFPGATMVPSLITGGTDSRHFRKHGAVAYGAGLMSPAINLGEFFRRFHGHDERIDVESLELTTQLWLDVVADMQRAG